MTASPPASRQQEASLHRRAFMWTLAGNVIYSGSHWAVIVVMARLGTPEMLGQWALALALASPIALLFGLNIRVVQATDIRGKYEFGHYLALTLVTSALASVTIVAVAFAAGYGNGILHIIAVVAAAKSIEQLSEAFYGAYQQRQRMDRIALSRILKAALLVALAPLVLVLLNEVFWVGAAMLAAYLSVLVAFEAGAAPSLLKWSQRRKASLQGPCRQERALRLRPLWNRRKLGALFFEAAPMGLILFLISLNTQIPRYTIEGYHGKDALGVFAALSYFGILGSMFFNAAAQPALAPLAVHYAASERDRYLSLVRRLLVIAAAFGATGIIIAMTGGRAIVEAVYGAPYAQDIHVLTLIMVGAAVSYFGSALGYSVTAARYIRIQLPIFAAVAGASAFSSLWLVPQWGLSGAAAALVIGYAVQLILSAFVFAKAILFPFSGG